MLSNIYLLAICSVAIAEIIKPVYGIYCLTCIFLVSPDIFFPEFNDYHFNIVIAIILSLSIGARGFKFRNKAFITCVILFLFFGFYSCILAEEVRKSFTLYYSYLKIGFFSILIVSCIKKRDEVVTLLIFCVVGATFNSIYAIYEQAVAKVPYYDLYRSSGTMADSNFLAAVLVSLFPFGYYLYSHEKVKIWKLFGLLNVFLIPLGVFMTISRGGILGLAFTGANIFLKNIKRISFLFIFLIIGYLFYSYGMEKYTERTQRSGATVVDSNALARLGLYKIALKMWIDNPLFGIGPNQFNLHLRSYAPELTRLSYNHVHNTFLHILCEHGIFGFLTFITLIVLSFKSIARLRFKKEDTFYQELAWHCQIALMGYIICAMFITQSNNYFFWILITIPIILENLAQDERSEGYHVNQLQTRLR